MTNQIKSTYEIAVEEIQKATKGTKIAECEVATGISFFEGKKRLCKVLKSKKSIAMEINVNLDKATEEKFNLNKISPAMAHQKHLGTMKYMANIAEPKDAAILIKAMVTSFKAELAASKSQAPVAVAQ